MNLLRKYVREKLTKNLSPTLKYHGLRHTEDVVNSAQNLAKLESISNKRELQLLEAAAWFHDIGFITTYKGHEEESCRIAQKSLPDFGFTKEEIDSISGMIMATKIPQNPQNHLEQILADADLDYLGRDDFDEISQSLFLELKEREMISDINSWNRIQVSFLSSHNYWTPSAIKLRKELKLKKLKEIENTLSSQ